VIPAIWVISVPFHFLRRNQYERPVLSSFRVDAAIYVHYFRRITICVVAAASARVIRHAPCRIKPFVDSLILRWMVTRGVAFSIFLSFE